MRHVQIEVYGQPPCGGEVISEASPPEPALPGGPRRLPVLGAAALPADDASGQRWRCVRCDKIWLREPRPEEAL